MENTEVCYYCKKRDFQDNLVQDGFFYHQECWNIVHRYIECPQCRGEGRIQENEDARTENKN